MMTRRCLFVLFAIAINSLSYAAPPPLLCLKEEKILFSCRVGAKIAALCGSSDLTSTTGYLQYRFGKTKHEPELIFPKSKTHPKNHFRYSEGVGGGRGSMSNLQFEVGAYTYTVYLFRHAVAEQYAGIAFRRGHAPLKFVACRETDVDELQQLSYLSIPPIDESQFTFGPE